MATLILLETSPIHHPTVPLVNADMHLVLQSSLHGNRASASTTNPYKFLIPMPTKTEIENLRKPRFFLRMDSILYASSIHQNRCLAAASRSAVYLFTAGSSIFCASYIPSTPVPVPSARFRFLHTAISQDSFRPFKNPVTVKAPGRIGIGSRSSIRKVSLSVIKICARITRFGFNLTRIFILFWSKEIFAQGKAVNGIVPRKLCHSSSC